MDKVATTMPRQKPKTTFYVGHDMQLPEGGRLIGARLSGVLHSRFQLKKALERIRRQYPDAHGIMSVRFC